MEGVDPRTNPALRSLPERVALVPISKNRTLRFGDIPLPALRDLLVRTVHLMTSADETPRPAPPGSGGREARPRKPVGV